MKLRAKQGGIALIMAMTIFAIVTALAYTMLLQQETFVRRAGNTVLRDQALLYNIAAEGWVGDILKADAEDNKFDHPGEEWATEIPPLPVDGGSVQGRLYALDGKLNINSIIQPDNNQPSENNETPEAGAPQAEGENAANTQNRERVKQPKEIARERLGQIFDLAGLDPSAVSAVIDWIDEDIEPTGSSGAEEDVYLSSEEDTVYRNSNHLMSSVAELALVKGLDDIEILKKEVYPHLVALPLDAKININTAEERVLVAIGVPEQSAKSIVEAREDKPYEDLKSFLVDAGLDGNEQIEKTLSVQSTYFLLETESKIGPTRLQMVSIIKRASNGDTTIVARKFGTL